MVTADLKALKRHMKACGLALGGPRRWGKKVVRRDGVKVYVPNPKERALMEYIVRLRDTHNLTWDQVVDHVERAVAKRDGRPVQPLFKRQYSRSQVKTAYRSEKALQDKYRWDKLKVEIMHLGNLPWL